MRVRVIIICTLIFGLNTINAQKKNHNSLQFEYLYGSVLKHKPKISHLAISHPQGFAISFNKKTTKLDTVLAKFNYPEYGLTFTYQNFKNEILGKVYALQFHHNFYFTNRKSKNQCYLKLAEGLSYVTNPFNLKTNNKNVAIGSHINTNVSIGLHYKRTNIINGFDATIGLLFAHSSNGSIKPPNTGINTISLATGINYNFDYKTPVSFNTKEDNIEIKKAEPIKYNLQFIAGINSTNNLLNKQFPYYTVSAYVDKRLNNRSIVNFGSEIFFSKFLKELIQYNAVAFPEKPNETGNADYKRVSLIAGHELSINKTSILTQVGYYIYYPYKYETRIYQRVGVKKYFNNKLFASVSIKSHLFVAESIDFSIGIRL